MFNYELKCTLNYADNMITILSLATTSTTTTEETKTTTTTTTTTTALPTTTTPEPGKIEFPSRQ